MLEGAEAQSGPWEPVGEVAQSAGAGEARLEYGHILGGATNLWYHAVPYDAEGNPGEPSNAVLRPSNEPIIYSVTPTSGYQHEEYTLTVTNSYGSDDYPFTLTVSARDTWAHTWGGGGRDEPTNIAVDTEGNVYVVGSAPSFGAVLLKYNPGGDLLCVRSWGGIGGAVDVSVAPENGIYIAGTTRDYGPGEVASALITKFDANCNFQWARAWGGPWRTSGGAVVAIRSGGCYVAGERSKEAYAVDSLFVLRLDGDGNLLQQKAWRPDGFVDVKAAGLDADGSLYIAGSLNNPSLTNEDGLLVKYDAGLNFQWARQWGVQGRDDFGDLRIGQGNSILIAGYTEDGDPEWGNAVLLDFDALGALRRTQLFPVLSGRYPKISLAECNTSWYFAISGYWLKGSLLILDAGADSGVLHEAEELSGCVVECSPSSDAYVLATVTALPWAWSTGAQISGNEFDVDAVEALGENGDWDGQIVELDIEASTPHGHVDGYTPVSDNGDLILMKNSP